MRTNAHWFIAIILWGGAVAPVRAEITLIGEVVVSGEIPDKSGLTGTFDDGVPVNRFGGVSAIERLEGNQFLLLSDRGPDDGAVPFQTRFHIAEISIPDSGSQVGFELKETRLLRKSGGASLVGASNVLTTQDDQPGRFDPEGFRVVLRDQSPPSLAISEEYAPRVDLYDLQGTRTRAFEIPERYQILHPSGDAAVEARDNQSGRQPNGGIEGLAVAPDSRTIYAIMQRPLLQDSALLNGRFTGQLNRILRIDAITGETSEFIYPLDSPETVVCEMLCLDSSRALVLERDSKGGPAAQFKRLALIDLSQATDISNIESLPAELGQLPPEIKAAMKTPWLDLLDPRFGIVGENTPSKFEGLSWGPDLSDGRHTLLVAVDNDFKADRPTRIFVFAVTAEETTPSTAMR